MTTLQPTPSRRRMPRWAVVTVAAVLGVALIGGGLLLTTTGGDDSPAASPTPTCTPTAVAPPAKVAINVYNATDRAGLAASTADELATRGFVVDLVDNDPTGADVTGTAEIRFVGAASAAPARWAAAQVPLAPAPTKVAARGHDGAKVDLVIGDDFDGLATTEEARVAFAASAPAPAC